jgi:hypothetical protein
MPERELPLDGRGRENPDDQVDRRRLLAQGIKLAYVVPAVLATMKVNTGVAASGGPAPGPQPAPAPGPVY